MNQTDQRSRPHPAGAGGGAGRQMAGSQRSGFLSGRRWQRPAPTPDARRVRHAQGATPLRGKIFLHESRHKTGLHPQDNGKTQAPYSDAGWLLHSSPLCPERPHYTITHSEAPLLRRKLSRHPNCLPDRKRRREAASGTSLKKIWVNAQSRELCKYEMSPSSFFSHLK